MSASTGPEQQGLSVPQIVTGAAATLVIGEAVAYALRTIDSVQRIVFLSQIRSWAISTQHSWGLTRSAWAGFGIMVVLLLLWMGAYFTRMRVAARIGVLLLVTTFGVIFAQSLIIPPASATTASRATSPAPPSPPSVSGPGPSSVTLSPTEGTVGFNGEVQMFKLPGGRVRLTTLVYSAATPVTGYLVGPGLPRRELFLFPGHGQLSISIDLPARGSRGLDHYRDLEIRTRRRGRLVLWAAMSGLIEAAS